MTSKLIAAKTTAGLMLPLWVFKAELTLTPSILWNHMQWNAYTNIMPAAGLQRTGEDLADLQTLGSGYQHGTAAHICVRSAAITWLQGKFSIAWSIALMSFP